MNHSEKMETLTILPHNLPRATKESGLCQTETSPAKFAANISDITITKDIVLTSVIRSALVLCQMQNAPIATRHSRQRHITVDRDFAVANVDSSILERISPK